MTVQSDREGADMENQLQELNRNLEDPGNAKIDGTVKTMEDFTSPEQLYQELIASVRKYHPSRGHFDD